MTILTAALNSTNSEVSDTKIWHFSKVSIYNFVYAVSLVMDALFIATVLLGSFVPIQVFLCVVTFTSITYLEAAVLRLSQSMQLLGARPFGKAPKSQVLF
jgi:hypothetical protein